MEKILTAYEARVQSYGYYNKQRHLLEISNDVDKASKKEKLK